MHLRMYVGGIMPNSKSKMVVTCPVCEESREVLPRNGYDKTTVKICAVCLRKQLKTQRLYQQEKD